MAVRTRIPTEHKQVGFVQGQIMRDPSPYFAPPVLTGMREPGTNYITLITAQPPHTTESPGITGGIRVGANNRPAPPVGPLTRKGG